MFWAHELCGGRYMIQARTSVLENRVASPWWPLSPELVPAGGRPRSPCTVGAEEPGPVLWGPYRPPPALGSALTLPPGSPRARHSPPGCPRTLGFPISFRKRLPASEALHLKLPPHPGHRISVVSIPHALGGGNKPSGPSGCFCSKCLFASVWGP